MNKKKILRIITTLNPSYGGASSAIIDHSTALEKQGFSVHILTCDLRILNIKTQKKSKL